MAPYNSLLNSEVNIDKLRVKYCDSNSVWQTKRGEVWRLTNMHKSLLRSFLTLMQWIGAGIHLVKLSKGQKGESTETEEGVEKRRSSSEKKIK